MAGGSFLFENKIRPGCYIQLKGVPSAQSSMSERGIAVILMNADSGGLLTELSANDILTGACTKAGFPISMFTDTKNPLNYLYPYVNKIFIGRLNYGGDTASANVIMGDGDPLLSASARFPGTFGNSITISIVAEQTGQGKYRGVGFFVRTAVNNVVVDEQNIKLPGDLVDNDYVTFTKATALTAFSAVASVSLTGGTNGTESDTNLGKILGRLTGLQWNTIAYCGSDTNRNLVVTYIRNLRENKGKYRQAVIYNKADADYEGVISTFQAFAVDGDDIDFLSTENADTAKEAQRQAALHQRQMFAVSYVAGITAGADVNISNTYRLAPANVIGLVPDHEEDEDVESDLRAGLLTFTRNSESQIVVEKDINTLHTYDMRRTRPFSKNRVIRCLDEMSNTKTLVWERSFIGKIDNNETGRNLFKAQVLRIIDDLVSIGAVSSGEIEVVVEQGDTPDSVRSYEQLRPIDAMEILYSYVTVLG